jgi:uncharacterized membrane protein
MIFIGYSFLGKAAETIFYFIFYKKWLNRGFLYGPFMPIYGIAIITVGPIIMMFKSSIFMVFIISFFLSSLLEYIISYIGQKIFNHIWWDYSMEPFNLNGRVCLKDSMIFGFAGIIYIYLTNPLYTKFLNSIDHNLLIIISIPIMIIFTLDLIISSIATIRLKNKGKLKKGDHTEEIKKEIRKLI